MDNIHKGHGKCEKYLEKSGQFVVRKSGNHDTKVIRTYLVMASKPTCGVKVLVKTEYASKGTP